MTRRGLWLLIALALSGCVQIEVRTVINPDGSGSLALAYGIDVKWLEESDETLTAEQVLADPEEFTDQTPMFDGLHLLQGVQVSTEEFREGNVQWHVQRFTLPDLNRLGSAVGSTTSFVFERQTDAAGDVYRYHWRSLTMMTDFFGMPPEDFAAYQQALRTDPMYAQLGEFKLRWVVQMPGEVIKHNADDYDPASGTLTWNVDLESADDWDFWAESRLGDARRSRVAVAVFGLLTALGAGLLGLALFKLLAWRKGV